MGLGGRWGRLFLLPILVKLNQTHTHIIPIFPGDYRPIVFEASSLKQSSQRICNQQGRWEWPGFYFNLISLLFCLILKVKESASVLFPHRRSVVEVIICPTPSIAFRHLPPKKDAVNECLELGEVGWGWGWGVMCHSDCLRNNDTRALQGLIIPS